MTRETWCEARTQGAFVGTHIGATEDAAWRRGAPVRHPGSSSGQALAPGTTRSPFDLTPCNGRPVQATREETGEREIPYSSGTGVCYVS
jgi:hypothetical protein